jgi:UDPglucose 6-dehydrogenase
MNVSFVGLGKLGLPLACCLAKSGNKILGVDKNEYILEKLNNQELPFYEPGLSDIFPHKNFIGFTDSYARAVEETDASIILVNTQLGDSGYSAEFVESALTDLSVNLKKSKKEYHLIVLSSTVLPGTINKLIPEFFLIGANNSRDISQTQTIWSKFHTNNAPKKILSLEEAEIAKVALNAFIVNKITFANFLGQLCDGMDNVNVHNITETIGLDKRISPYFFGYGTPYGGTCFPRDTSAFIKFAENRGKEAKHLKFADEVNESLHEDLLRKCSGYKNVGILGLSFKPASPVTIGSPSVRLIEKLANKGVGVFVYDELPQTYDNLNGLLDFVIKCDSAQQCVDKSDAIIIMHPNKSFASLDTSSKVFIDFWGVLS